MDLNRISYLVLNEVEAKGFSGQDDSQEFLRYMRERYPRLRVMLTLGKGGCIYSEGGENYYHPAYRVEAVDTTAAGDTFTGYFVALLANGLPYTDILRYASMASGIAVSRKGAAPSIPMLAEVEAAAATLLPYEAINENRATKQKKKILSYIEERYKCFEDAQERIGNFIRFYNEQRPHYSIGMKVPSQVHQETSPQQQVWKAVKEHSQGLSDPSC